MTPHPDDAAADWVLTGGLEQAKRVAAFTGVIAALLFAQGWIFMTVFYGRFGVDPARHGFDAQWMATRATASAIALMVVAGVAVAIPLFHQRASGARVVLMASVACAVVALGVNVSLATAYAPTVYRVFAVGAAALAVLWLPVRFLVTKLGRAEAQIPPATLALATAALIGLGSVAATPWIAANRFADQAEAGEGVRIDLGVGLPLLDVEPVTVHTKDPIPVLRDGDCALPLGDDGSRLSLYVPRLHTTVAAAGDVTLVRRPSRRC